MSTVVISPEEYELLEKRWFFIRDSYLFIEFLKSMFAITILVNSLGWIVFIFTSKISVIYFIIGLLLWLYMILSYKYVTSSKMYYTQDWIVGFWMKTKEDIIDSKINEISLMWDLLLEFFKKSNWQKISKEETNDDGGLFAILIPLAAIGTFNIFLYFWIFQNSVNVTNIVISFWPMVGIILIFSSITFLINKLINTFHPLYVFGNLGEKIQKLTPRIEEQSKQIQSEFQSDMNFSVLSDGFDSLSVTFSEIVALVIKLEKVEARANKWNLFDSEKYINSLRSDIITPLRSLREFLENQKNTLLESQKELMQVRVEWKDPEINSGWQEHIELQSKRSESLIVELTENIEKLNVMIGNIG